MGQDYTPGMWQEVPESPSQGGLADSLRTTLLQGSPRIRLLVFGALGLLLLVALVGRPVYFTLPANVYLPVHILTEVTAIVVGFAIFAVHWNLTAARGLRQPRALFLGAAFLGVALIDTIHLLAFPGMPGLVEPASTDRGIFYWLAARFAAAVALLVAVFITPQSRSPLLRRLPLLLLGLLPAPVLVWIDWALLGSSQPFYVEGVGLTPLKIACEYAIIVLCVLTATLYWREYLRTRDRAHAMLVGALLMTILSELAFTLYSTAYDTFNLLGHFYKAIAYYMIFDGLFLSTLLRPYNELDATMHELATSNRELTRLREHIEGELARTIATLEQTSQAERRARQSAEALADLSRDIAARVSLSELLDTVVRRTREIFVADITSLISIDAETGQTYWQAVDGNRTDVYREVVMPRKRALAGRAVEENHPVMVERFGDDPAFPPEEFPILVAESVRSALAVPYGLAGRSSGAIVIGYRREHHFTHEELSLAGSVADHIAVAVQSARLYDEVRRRAAELDAVLASIADGVVVYNPQGSIVRANATAESILGLGQEGVRMCDAQGRPLRAERHPSARALRGETVVGEELLLEHADGRVYRVGVSVAPVRGADGRLLGAVSTLHDITALVEMERRGEEFVRIVTHDIRQPLTVILGQAQLMRPAVGSGNRERLESGLGAILTSAKRMNAMIRDLADITRLEMGQLELARQPLDVAGFIAEVLERLAGAMDTARVRLEVSPEPLAPASVDPDRLERIVTNLISNALKYSQAGMEVFVSVRPGEEGVVVAVSDHGPGIAPADLPHIFERFYRASGEHKQESLGLGLYITRMLVEAHGGRIWAESKPGKGSTFTFALPYVEGQA